MKFPTDPLARALVFIVLCPTVWVVGCWVAGLMPGRLDVSVLILTATAAAACPVLLLLDLAHRVALDPLREARERARVGKCANCGYDLRATPARCPECGRVPAREGAPPGPR